MSEKTELRIVAGTLRGRKLTCVVHPGMRPTPQMVREALFSILGNAVPGRPFFDVFAGTGIFGLEAVSRGATRAALVEFDGKQVREIQRAIDKFEVNDKVHVLRADAYRWAERWVTPPGGPVNVFLSPPFPDLHPDRLAAFLKLVTDVFAKLSDESTLTIQAEDGFPEEVLPDLPAWDVRKYGRNRLYVRVKGDPVPGAAAPAAADAAAE